MAKAIPRRTMSDVSRAWARRTLRQPVRSRSTTDVQAPNRDVSVTPFRKPRQWRYQTRPVFKRLVGPLVDVFNEAEEVLIVVDLGGFTRGEIAINMTPRQYVLRAARGAQRFEEFIELPENVDIEHAEERLLNGVLEIILPRKKDLVSAPVPRSRPRKNGS